jgi:hypothetical protein
MPFLADIGLTDLPYSRGGGGAMAAPVPTTPTGL